MASAVDGAAVGGAGRYAFEIWRGATTDHGLALGIIVVAPKATHGRCARFAFRTIVVTAETADLGNARFGLRTVIVATGLLNALRPATGAAGEQQTQVHGQCGCGGECGQQQREADGSVLHVRIPFQARPELAILFALRVLGCERTCGGGRFGWFRGRHRLVGCGSWLGCRDATGGVPIANLPTATDRLISCDQ